MIFKTIRSRLALSFLGVALVAILAHPHDYEQSSNINFCAGQRHSYVYRYANQQSHRHTIAYTDGHAGRLNVARDESIL